MPGPRLRFSLLQDMNTHYAVKIPISSASLYRSLEKLEANGFVSFTRLSKSGKIGVEGTEKARAAIMEVIKYATLGAANYQKVFGEVLFVFLNRVGRKKFNSMLLLNCDSTPDIRFANQLTVIANEVSILADMDNYTKYLDLGLNSDILQSRIQNGVIREPDHFFDCVMLPTFDKVQTSTDAILNDLVSEILRVTKYSGFIVIPSFAPIKENNHFLLEEIINSIISETPNIDTGKKILEKNLKDLGLTSIEFFEHKGLQLGWGKVSAENN